MRILFALSLLGLCACEPPVARLAPVPAPQDLQSRVMPIDRVEVFPKVLEMAMSLGYHIRFASAELGQLNLYQEWQDQTLAAQPHTMLELTIRFTKERSGFTRMHLLGTGRGQGLRSLQEAVPLGPAECRELLDQFQRRLCPAPRS